MMESEEYSSLTPQSGSKSKVPGSKTASSLKKFVSKRLSRSISSERGTGSASSFENNDASGSGRRFTLRPRRSKKMNKSLTDRPETTPRRSLSVDDLAELTNQGSSDTFELKDDDVKTSDIGDTEQFVRDFTSDREGNTSQL